MKIFGLRHDHAGAIPLAIMPPLSFEGEFILMHCLLFRHY